MMPANFNLYSAWMDPYFYVWAAVFAAALFALIYSLRSFMALKDARPEEEEAAPAAEPEAQEQNPFLDEPAGEKTLVLAPGEQQAYLLMTARTLPSGFALATADLASRLRAIPVFEIAQADRFMRFVEEIRLVKCSNCAGPFYASGESTVFYEIVKMLSSEGKYVMGFAVLCVLGALAISFRSFSRTAIVFMPMIIGTSNRLLNREPLHH